MPKTRAPYPAEFRAEMVRLVRAGRTPGELSREFEPSDQTIRNWVNQADVDEGRREGLTTAEREELRRLRRENRTLREETEILAKAAAWFAEKSSDRPRGGVWVRESQPGLPFRAAHVQPPGCARPAATTHGSAAAHPPANTLIGHCGTGSSISTAGHGAPMVLPAFTPN